MTEEDDINALTYDISPSDSEEEEQQGGEEEEIEEQEGKKEETKTEQKETKQSETEKNIEGGEKGAEKTGVSPKTLEREAVAALTALSTPIKQKKRGRGRPQCISRPGKAQG